MLGLLAALTAETKVRCCTRGAALNCLNAVRTALLVFWDAISAVRMRCNGWCVTGKAIFVDGVSNSRARGDFCALTLNRLELWTAWRSDLGVVRVVVDWD